MPTIRTGLTEESKARIEQMQGASRRLHDGINHAIRVSANDMVNHLKANMLRGGSIHEQRNGNTPLASRTGMLMASIKMTMGDLQASVGSAKGPASPYAATQLGPDPVTITPKKSKWLWIPVADNLTGKGRPRVSPTEAREMKDSKGKPLLRIFKSKAGNMVALLMADGKVPGVKRKGNKLLFVLKKEVTVQGTNALAQAVQDKMGDLHRRLSEAVRDAATPGAGGMK